jgi:signal peptidase complex subunit 3
MHTLVSRVNNASAFLSSCMMALLAAIAISSFFLGANSSGQLEVAPVKVFAAKARRHYSGKQDAAFVNFNVTADLSPLFHWNTKQLFIYLEGEYTNMHGVQNTVVIWDKIVRRKRDARIKIEGGKNKYVFRELSTTFKDVTPASYSLKYNLMPYVGALEFGEIARTSSNVSFPEAQPKVSK